MGKPKRGKKQKQDDDWEDAPTEELNTLSLESKDTAIETNGQLDEVQNQAKSKKKDKKKKAVKEVESDEVDDEDDEQVSNKPAAQTKGLSAFQMLSLESDEQSDNSGNSSEEEIEAVSKPVSKKNKKKQKQAASYDGESEDEEMAPKPVEEDIPKPVQSKAKNKKKGQDKKAEKEEDIDALLAEIETKPESSKGKKKKKGKGQADVEEMASSEPADKATSQTKESAETPPTEPTPQINEDMAAKDISEMTQDEIAAWLDNDDYEEDERANKKKKKKKDRMLKLENEDVEEKDEADDDDEGTSTGTVKTAAQKKKEKKERQKQQKLQEKQQPKKKAEKTAEAAKAGEIGDVKAGDSGDVKAGDDGVAEAEPGKDDDMTDESSKKKKKKEKKKKGEEEETEKKKKPSKMARAIQEMQQKIKDEEERQIREEQEKDRLFEEARRLKEENDRKEAEKRERDKQKKKEKIERLKAEGKYLSAKQKEDRKRAEQMLEALKAQGLALPQPGEKVHKKPIYGKKRKKPDQKKQDDVTPAETPTEEKQIEIAIKDPPQKPEEKTEEVLDSWEDVKDSWDADSEEEPEKETQTEKEAQAGTKEGKVEDRRDGEDSEDESEDEDSEDDSEDESSDESSDEDEDMTPRERALNRIQKRKELAESRRTVDKLRAPVVCVLGHVDTGKTKILDKLRRTHVQDDEAGGITQQIGATNVPADKIQEQTKMCKEFAKQELKLPGLLIIDTPGHESFSNLRNRGSSLCDIAILVIDLMHGLEPQTIESINLLKQRKTPFIVALNKVDRLFQWQSNPHTDIVNTLKKQKTNTRQEFDERVTIATVQLAEQGLNACLFHENKNPREYISMVPTSAHSGDGMGNLIALICELTQSMLAKRISLSEELQATVMEVKAIQGLGTTIDVILVNGSISEGDTIVVAGQEGPIVTQVRALLMPQPMKELRVKNAYNKYKDVNAAQGCKIIAKDLEKALAGLPLYIAHKQDEIEYYKEELSDALGEVLASIKLQERGVFVQASTLGSLEALLEFLSTSKIPYAGINIGPVHRKDIMKASIMLEHDSQWAVILAFDVKVEREAQEMADAQGVRIFTADIIYHLFDQFMSHRDKLKKKKQEEFKHVAVFPCKLRVLPQYVFNSRDPIVCGVIIEAGFVKEGMPLCVPSKEFCELGRVTSIENNHKAVDKATKGQEVCIKIEPIPGDTPKLFGRHFDETDMVYSRITRQSIDAVKNYFREEMKKEDWQLVIEMKKLFEIL